MFVLYPSLSMPNKTNEPRHKALAEALSQLGISNVYHMREVGKNKHQDLWIQALEDNIEGKGPAWGREDFENILAGFEVRVPTMGSWQEWSARSVLMRCI